jgi:hypothetical protein
MSEKCVTIAMALAAIASFASPASAVPTAYHNPATGSLRIINDVPGPPLPMVWVSSKSGRLFDMADAYASVPGAIFDIADVPTGITYLNFPVGDYEIGNVVAPGTSCSDLFIGYYVHSLLTPPNVGVIICVPEPSSGVMITLVLFAVSGVVRRSSNARFRKSAGGGWHRFLNRCRGATGSIVWVESRNKLQSHPNGFFRLRRSGSRT